MFRIRRGGCFCRARFRVYRHILLRQAHLLAHVQILRFQQDSALEVLGARQLGDRWASVERRTDQRVAKFLVHNFHEHVLLGDATVDLGGDDDRIWRHGESVLGDGATNIANGYFGRERFAVKDARLDIAIVNVN
jgi:hypothetical protein